MKIKTETVQFLWTDNDTHSDGVNENRADYFINEWLDGHEGFYVKNIVVLTMDIEADRRGYYRNQGRILIIFEKIIE